MAHPLKNPKAGPRIRVNLTLDPVIYPEAREKAHSEGRSTSDVITKLLQKWLRGSVKLDS